MATVLKFKQGDTGTELNLNSSTVGFTLEEAGWLPAVAVPVHMGDPAPVMERIDLILNQTTYNALAASMQSLHEMQVLADRYINDPHQETPVWLHAQMDGETNQRRALVRRIDVQYKPQFFGRGEVTTYVPVLLSVVRGPYWESTTARNLPDAAPSAAACVVYNYTAAGDVVSAHDIVGDVGARLRFFTMQDSGGDNISRFWMGIRTANKHGATGISNFANVWECEDGSNSTDATDTVDATASGGNRVTVSESGIDWDDGDFHKCLHHRLTTASANEEDQFGNFLWLLRAKVTAGTWEVRLKATFGSATINDIYTDPIELDETAWRFNEMGIIPISLRKIHSILNSDIPKTGEASYRMEIYARRTSGAGDLHLDCFIPIPVDEGFCNLNYDPVANTYYSFGESPEGIVDTVLHTAVPAMTEVSQAVESWENFTLPPGDGRIYCVYEDGTNGSDITDVVTFNPADEGRYYERWLSLRGSE